MIHDVVVVGGIAGMIAALRAAELGAKVVVLEKGQGEQYLCNTRYSSGILHLDYRDPKTNPAELEAQMTQSTDGKVNPALLHALATDGARLIDWLRSQSVAFVRFSAWEAYRWCMAPPRKVGPGLDWKGRGPDVMLRKLGRQLTERGGKLMTGVTVTDLIMRDGRCVGVTALRDGNREEWSARTVVVADGGFQANAEMFRRHIGPAFEKIKQRGAATDTGAGIEMAVRAGAATTDMSRFYGHLLHVDCFTNDKVWPYPEMDALATAGIVIDKDGCRFTDEGEGGVPLANRIARFDDPQSCTIVFDSAIWEGPGKDALVPTNPYLERGGGTVLKADTLEDLARQMGVPAATFVETVTAYNKAIAENTGTSLKPPRRSDVHPAWKIEKKPFRACRIVPGITYTMGGIAIDEHARVLSTEGSPIPGLFAAGTTTGGIEGFGRTGYIGGLTKSGIFGLRAGESASELARTLA